MNDDDFRSSRIDINGVATEVLEIGEGAPLVFLHGTGTFPGFGMARDWAAAGYRVVIPYHPNFGASGDRPDYDTVTDYVLHYAALFDALGLDRIDLAGFSLGGWLAAEYALHHPRQVRRLALIAPSGLDVPDAPAPDLFAIPPQEVPAWLAHDPGRILKYLPPAPDPAFDAALGREMQGYGRLLGDRPQGSPVLKRWLGRLTMPVLLLWGAEDRLRPTAQAQAWASALPDARIALVPETGHLVFEESPAAAQRVIDFLRGDDMG